MILYMRYTDAKGNVSIQSHSVWDKDRFIESQQKAFEKEGGTAVVATAGEYRDRNWTKPL